MADTEKKTINKDINFRIKKVRKNLGFTQKEFAKKLGLSQNHLSYIERGERKVFQNLINAIFIEFGVNREWLKTGKGNIYVLNEYIFLGCDFIELDKELVIKNINKGLDILERICTLDKLNKINYEKDLNEIFDICNTLEILSVFICNASEIIMKAISGIICVSKVIKNNKDYFCNNARFRKRQLIFLKNNEVNKIEKI
ncbi:helix-turn-helix domain-containing protein [Clostridioides difficile]|uniref:helix-turn-helix domain-containing protein n=7 Tax=Clostridioides difficile TaxID=1496 RepID=UPI00038CD473|nr:helix-turn-helix transcriptional regulator [Clostridioides difficile]EGT3815264.1 XRE family transcriptional regulator [Clostridioides difficile]EGT4202971.1 XRE family transcriptional regulator [Clostridioides difficile]ELX4570413.1 helix-turn-helix transcriptional regulator [Clostridioides difficile]EQJ94815.1 helix-turn-helix family protein [Clostridioides difficile P49]MBY1421605.1 helix-turn-helix transcriptional regulator [Clostridioides difficile]